MAKPRSPRSIEALKLLGLSIKAHRLRRRWSIDELAERVGVSHPTIIKVERGDPTVAVGTVFEAATLVGVPLFDSDPLVRARQHDRLAAELVLLPKAARPVAIEIDDDF